MEASEQLQGVKLMDAHAKKMGLRTCNLNIKRVAFKMDTFNINKSRMPEFREQCKHRDLYLVRSRNAVVDTLDSKMLKSMKKGCGEDLPQEYLQVSSVLSPLLQNLILGLEA